MVVSDSNGSNAKGGVLVDRWGRARIGTMSHQDLIDRLRFIQSAERLKNVLRSGHTSEGRRESTPEHTWRLCLLAMVLQDRLPALDFERVLKICVVQLRSARWFAPDDLRSFGHRSRVMQMGYAPGGLARQAGDRHRQHLERRQPVPRALQAARDDVKRGVLQAGGFPVGAAGDLA
jgi:hypothetical protein